MRSAIALFLCLTFATNCFAADSNKGYAVTYAGGSVPSIKSKSWLRLFLETNEIRIRYRKEAPFVIPASTITSLTYTRDSRRRVVEAAALGVFTLGIGSVLALSKSNKHFIGLTWDDPATGSKGGLAVQVRKGDYHGVLLALEAITGKKVVDLDVPVPAGTVVTTPTAGDAPKP